VSAVYNEGESAVTEIETIEILGMSGIDGTVTDVDSGDGIEGATITISANSIEQEYVVTTDVDGYYTTDVAVVDGGYTVTAHAGGYVNQSDENVVVVANTYTTVDFVLGEIPMPVSDVVAVENSDAQSTVMWSLPSEYPVYELFYDDGVVGNATAWNAGYEGNMNAIKFTPSGYPAIVKTAKVHIYDGTWPAGNILSPTEIVVLDDDGGDGMPGTELGSITLTPTDYNWVEVDFSAMNISIADGDFYIAQRQISTYPDCPPTAIADGTPANRSYAYSSGAWGVASYDCFMIRAGISGPRGDETLNYDGTAVVVKETRNEGAVAIKSAERYPGVFTAGIGNVVEITPAAPADRALTGYEVYRFERDDIAAPANWDLLTTVTATVTEYIDNDWGLMAQGVYYYAVKAIYTITEADAVLSNPLPKNMYSNVVFMISLDTGDDPTGTMVKLENLDEPEYVYEAICGASGTVNFPEVWKGNYLLTVALDGYTPHFDNIAIEENYFVKPIELLEAHATPIDLAATVDCEDVHLTWAEGNSGGVDWTQDFEGDFPPEGWNTTTNGAGWIGTENGSSTYWDIPNHTKYACANDDGAGSGNDGSNDYLISPIQGFVGFTAGTLSFESFYTGAYSQAAYVEFSTDGGASWEVIYTVAASDSWETITIDLAEYLTNEYAQVLIGFHADDNGSWASGWAIDDVSLSLGIGARDIDDREYLGYNVYRNDELLTDEPIAETEYYDYGVSGGYYDYYVTAAYSTGDSDPSNVASVEIEVINPAQNLTAEKQSWNNAFLEWEAPADQPIYSIQWDDGVNYTAIGTNGAFDFDVASRWLPEDLGTYDGMWLTEVSFFPNEADCDYYIRVYTGSDATLVVDQAVASPTIGEWNTVTLNTPVAIDASEEFWFGYRADANAGYPAGCDAGSAVAGKGDMIYDADEGWLVMSEAYGLNYNWNLAGTVVAGAGQMATLGELPAVERASSSKGTLSTSGVINNNSDRLVTDREIIGYNVLRDGAQVNEYLVDRLWYIDYDLPIEAGVGVVFNYTVVAEYASGCPAPESNIATLSYGTDAGANEEGLINVYPNPATSNVNVVLTDNIESLRVMNYLGQIVYNQSITSENVVNIKTESLVAGAYLIQLTTDEGNIINKRFIIVK
ncbi:MAG: carboxypeptidase regulatory-like domain-containing protein, partial [Bacteroidota bacterium]|nr:carboxypeptidase regulatory-like domain-containing protein [Bacteroidota bacterium]